jgi:hypothetical protein
MEVIMQSLDIPFPNTEYQIMNQYKTFNLIYPSDHPLSQTVKIDMTIRALSFDDPDYVAFLQNNKKAQDMVPIGGKIFEISYLRECKVTGVAKFEWRNNYGPNSVREFLKMAKTCDKDSFVKIISLKAPSYSLKELNQKYGL